SNLRPSGPKPDALPDCATLRSRHSSCSSMSSTEHAAAAGRRGVLQAGAAGLLALLAPACVLPPGAPPHGAVLPAFDGVPPSSEDTVVVPSGYQASVLLKWGDDLGIAGAPVAGQAVQAGMHHDGMHFFALADDGTRGLLVLNHEYTDEG